MSYLTVFNQAIDLFVHLSCFNDFQNHNFVHTIDMHSYVNSQILLHHTELVQLPARLISVTSNSIKKNAFLTTENKKLIMTFKPEMCNICTTSITKQEKKTVLNRFPK